MRRILTISALLLALARSSATAHAQNLEAPVHPPGQPAGLAQKTSSTSHAPPSWLSIIAPVAGAFAAAWYGARLALRKTLRDLALTGRVQWYEEAIRSIANYEDVLARLRDNYLHEIIIKAQDPLLVLAEAATPAEQRKPTELFRPDRVRWKELVEAEARLRAGLQLHDVYTGGATRTWCAVARGHASLSRSPFVDVQEIPPINGIELSGREASLGSVRSRLEMELRRTLQCDGWLRAKSQRWNRWRAKGELARVEREFDRQRRDAVKRAAGAGTVAVKSAGVPASSTTGS